MIPLYYNWKSLPGLNDCPSEYMYYLTTSFADHMGMHLHFHRTSVVNPNAMFCGSSLKRLRKNNQQDSPPNQLAFSHEKDVSRGGNTCTDPSKFNSPNIGLSDKWSQIDDAYGTIVRRNQTLASPPGVNARTKGQLKLSITADHGCLTVHVTEARHLKSKWSESTSSYVEFSLLSEGKKEIQGQTKTAFSSEQPTFDEKFSIEVMANDKKRLKVAMYNKEGKENCVELLGCMSFGMKHLISRKKQVNGWYYLLPEDVGRRKHLQVPPIRHLGKDLVKSSSKESNLSKSSSLYRSGSIPEVNKSLQGLETLTIVVKRGRQGYGFTVMGSSPVSIGKVEEGTPAESAGLVKGDNVVRINGQNVSRSTADSVAKIVKTSLKQIILDIVRQRLPAKSSSSAYEGLTFSSAATSYENLPYTSGSNISVSRTTSQRKRTSSTRPSPAGVTPVRGVNDTLPLRPSQEENRPASRRSRGSSSSSSSKKNYSSSSKRNCSSQNLARLHTSLSQSEYGSVCAMSDTLNENRSIYPLNNTLEESYEQLPWGEDEEIYFPQNEEIYDELPWKPFDCDLTRSRRSVNDATYETMYDADPKLEETIRESDNDTYVAEYAHTTLPELSVSFCDLSHQEKARQAAIQHLMLLEASFIGQMQYGIQRFSRPLRHCILSAREHRVLFQNVEKLVAFSEYHMRQLTKNGQTYADVTAIEEDRFIDIVGNVYCPKVPITCDAYERYNDGLKESLKLLSDLKTYEQFFEFLNSPEPSGNQPSIDDFLQKPSEHLEAVMVTLRTILSHTPSEHQDSEALRLVVEAFSNCLDNINGRPADQSALTNDESTMSFSSKTSSSGSRSSGGSKSSAASIDSQVLELQERLVFPEHHQVFQVATPSRHVIYSGELLRVEACMWSRVHVILLSDLLLVTRVDGDNLVVVEEPLLLPDIISAEFGKDHPSEFTLTAEVRSSLHSGWEPRHLLFRAPSMEQHCTWKSLLEQRISSFRAHRELMTGRCHEIMF